MHGVIRTGMAVLWLCIAACGESAKPLEQLLPKSGEVLGFVEDTSKGELGVDSATTLAGAAALPDVDGAVDAIREFENSGGWKKLAIEYYKKDTITIRLWVFEMTSTVNSQTLFTFMSTYHGIYTWVDVALGGDQSHMVDNGDYWYIQGQKGVYFIETITEPSAGNEQTAKDFATAVLAKLPK